MKWFISSDIHSFFDEWKTCLEEVGFQYDNPNHGLIVCGDIFDRGTKPLEVYKYIRKLPIERRVLIRGNHEYLLKDLVNRGYPRSYDDSNGTSDTLCYIAKICSDIDFSRRELQNVVSSPSPTTPEYNKWLEEQNKRYRTRKKKKFNNRKIKEILDWIDSDEWVDFYETPKYIFVHSFIPLKQYINSEKSCMAGYLVKDKPDEYNPNWRNASKEDWEEASWGCPYKLYVKHFTPEIQKGKTLVCGHWHTSAFWNDLDYKDEPEKQLDMHTSNPIYKSENYPNLIGLDACTVVTHKVNILILNSEEM